MKKYLLILCLLLQINLISHEIEKKYFFSICAIFKNEAPYLKEWIEYHRIQGCECFYLYNNESTDNFLKVLQPYIETGIVELIDWPNNKYATNHCPAQNRAYNHNLKSLKEVSEWVAYIDIDEFLLAKQGLRVSEYLHTFDRLPNVGALKVNWQLFGTSNVNKIPEGEPIIQYLIKKGFKKIALITTVDYVSVGKLRTEGYIKALKNNDIPLHENLILKIEDTDNFENQIENLIANNDIEAIFAVNEIFAVTAIKIAAKLNIKVPEQLSIIGFTDGIISKYSSPSITTVSQNGVKMGNKAAMMLIDRLDIDDDDEEHEEHYKTEVIETHLVERESTI